MAEIEMVTLTAERPPGSGLDARHRWALEDVLATGELSGHGPALVLGVMAALSLLLRLWEIDQPVVDGVRMLLATICIGLAPGALALLLLAAFPRLGVLEWLGLGIALSLSAAELLTLVSLGLHIPAVAIALALAAAEIAAALWLWFRPPQLVLEVSGVDGLVGLLLAVVAALLYVKGSPFLDLENEIHISVIRRLAEVPHPAIDNIYLVPHFIYTYPFPGTHYLLALISRLGALDPVLVYDKMRFFWGPAALLFLYLFVRVSLARAGIALTAVCTAAALVLNGAFADVPGLFWGQMAPFSHAGDVAMGVLLPGLLVLAVYFLEVPNVRGRAFFFAASLLLALMITIVHIREIVQFVVYLGSLFVFLLLVRRNRGELGRIALLAGATMGIVLVYTWWQRQNVATVDTIVQIRRQQLVELAQSMSPDRFFTPRFDDNRFSTPFFVTFYGGFPLLLLGIPLLPVFFPGRLGPLLMAASTAVYVAIIRFPFLTIAYIYATYYEIMFTPVRNMVFFAYCVAGILLYALAAHLARLRTWWLYVPSTLVAALALTAAWSKLGVLLVNYPDILLFGILGETAAAVCLVLWRRGKEWAVIPTVPVPKWALTFGILLTALCVGTRVPASSPANFTQLRTDWTNSDLAKLERCLPAGDFGYSAPYRACFPDVELVQWASTHLSTSAVLLADPVNITFLPLVMPQQIVVWPGNPDSSPQFTRDIFPTYFQWWDRTHAAYGVDPFFNTVESLPERISFIKSVGANYVALDPGNYSALKAVLSQWPDAFPPVYDDGTWALYGPVQTSS